MSIPRIAIRWPRSPRHAKGHAIVLAVLMWIGALVIQFTGSGDRGIAGPLKGADFVQFYTIGHLASEGRMDAMYDIAALHDAQAALVPESSPDLYPPVYPPQAAVLFMPVSGWSYQGALLVWNLLTIAGYALIVWSAWKPLSNLLPDRTLMIAAAAAFPPFWSLILHGQVTILVLGAFWAGWVALERQRPVLAGIAFGFLALKPQFGIPLAAVVLASRQWRMVAGAVVSVGAQVAAVGVVLGAEAFSYYFRTLPITLAYADLLEAKPYLSHSLRAVTRVAPNWIGLPVWVALAGIVLWYTVRVWRSDAPLRVRLGVVMLASVLVNPHLIIYDATVLSLPLLWFGAYMHEPERRERAWPYWVGVYWLYVTLFAPTAAAIGVQVSVFVMTWLLLMMAREVGVSRGAAVFEAASPARGRNARAA